MCCRGHAGNREHRTWGTAEGRSGGKFWDTSGKRFPYQTPFPRSSAGYLLPEEAPNRKLGGHGAVRGRGQGVVGSGGEDPRGGTERGSDSEMGRGVEGKAGERGGEDGGAQRLPCELQTAVGPRMTLNRAQGSYLQDNPVTFLGSQVQRRLSHHLLSLPQRHVVEVPVVEGVAELSA